MLVQEWRGRSRSFAIAALRGVTLAEKKLTVNDVLTSAKKALTATKHAVEDFCGANPLDIERRDTAVRNFVSNGRSMSFLLQKLKHLVDGYDEWDKPVKDGLEADALADFFQKARTRSEHIESPVIGQFDKFVAPVHIVSVQVKISHTPQGILAELIGTTKEGLHVVCASQETTYFLEGMPEEFVHVPLEELMKRHLQTLEGIYFSATERFGPK